MTEATKEARTRRPIPALICLLALTLLTALVWWRVINRDSAHDTKSSSCTPGPVANTLPSPRLISLVEHGRLDLGSMVSRRIKLDEVNDAFTAMKAGEVIRSVITSPG